MLPSWMTVLPTQKVREKGVYEFDGMSMRVEPVVEDGVLPLDHNNFASLFIFHYLKEESVVLQDQDQSRLVDAMEVVVK